MKMSLVRYDEGCVCCDEEVRCEKGCVRRDEVEDAK